MALKFIKLMGRKRGMMQLFDENGHVVPCTVIEAEPSVVTQVKTAESDGYEAVQLGFEKVTAKDPRRQAARSKKPQRKYFEKANIEARRFVKESRVDNTSDYSLGQEIDLGEFDGVEFVDITGSSKGKGFQGVMKRWGFKGGPAAHGSGFHRTGGSTGMRSTPGRCFRNQKRAGHMGAEQVTVQNLKVMQVDKENNVLIVRGSIPGPRGSVVTIKKSVKK